METVILFVVGVIVLVVGLLGSVAIHEWGHYFPAKKFGVHISKFMIGFGPTLFSRFSGATEFGLKAIPLGGYVAMLGMYAPSKGEATQTGSTGFFDMGAESSTMPKTSGVSNTAGRSFYTLPLFKRILIMLGGPFMNLVVALFLYLLVLVGFGVPQLTTTVGSVSECVVPATENRNVCSSDDPIAPAAAAGIVPGDRVLRISDIEVQDWEELTEIIKSSPGQPVEFIVSRNGKERSLIVTPILAERYVFDVNGEIALDTSRNPRVQNVGFVGIGSSVEVRRTTLAEVFPAVWQNIVGVVDIVITLPNRLVDVARAAFGSGVRDRNGPLSVVGVGRIAGEIASTDFLTFRDRVVGILGVLASLNVALFVFNLIPLLPLDGGHVAVGVYEAIRRRLYRILGREDPGPVNPGPLIPITFVVVAILGTMSLLLMYADIVNPIRLFD